MSGSNQAIENDVEEDDADVDDDDDGDGRSSYQKQPREDESSSPDSRGKRRKLTKFSFEFAPRAAAAAAAPPTPVPLAAVVPSKPPPARKNPTEWTEEATNVLLEAWGTLYLQNGRKSIRSDEWTEVAKKVNETSITLRTEAQCRNRLDTLKKKYKKEILRMEETMSSTSNWPYFKKMEELMGLPTSSPALRNHHQQRAIPSGLDYGEYPYPNSRNYPNQMNGLNDRRLRDGSEQLVYNQNGEDEDESDDDESDGLPPQSNKKSRDSGFLDSSSSRMLADSINTFGKIYERIEKSRMKHMAELERMRREFHRDLEEQKQTILERAQEELQTSNAFVNVSSNLGTMQIASADHNFASFMENAHYVDPNVDEGTSCASMNHVDFLASQFPSYSVESLAELYFANKYDLNLTVEILTQLELQVEGNSKQEHQSKPSDHAVSLNPLDFPALPTSSVGNIGVSKCTGGDVREASDAYKLFDNGTFSLFNVSSSSASSRDVSDFASAVRKIPSQDFEHSKNLKNASTFTCTNAIRNSQNSHGLYIGNGKSFGLDKMQNGRANASWLKTGDAVGNMYSESREEARDLARVRNAYFEQARLSYLVGNKALAKELSVKGQLYNIQMKAAHEKAREIIYKQRNPNSPVVQGKVIGKDPLIDLHGLHVNEAIHILRQEISMLRKKARSSGCPLQTLVCVGTGHHTKGSRTPARLPVAVERYLVEEGVEYSEPQPGLFRMVVK